MTIQDAIAELTSEDDLYTETDGLYAVNGPLFGSVSFSIWDDNNYLVAAKQQGLIKTGCLWLARNISADCLQMLLTDAYLQSDLDWLEEALLSNPIIGRDAWQVFDLLSFYESLQDTSTGG